jgi:folate-dependent phosphoribosylglycinamide formyltransferase PurN
MRLLPWFVQQFPQRILNIHPSLLFTFRLLEAQQQALLRVRSSGCTVHLWTRNSITVPLCRRQWRSFPMTTSHVGGADLEQEHMA